MCKRAFLFRYGHTDLGPGSVTSHWICLDQLRYQPIKKTKYSNNATYVTNYIIKFFLFFKCSLMCFAGLKCGVLSLTHVNVNCY